MKELRSSIEQVRARALGTLLDELQDPEKCFRAIKHFNVAKRLADVLHNEMKRSSYRRKRTCPIIVERSVVCASHVCSWLDGASSVADQQKMLDVMYDLINREDDISLKTAEAFSKLASHLIGIFTLSFV